MKVLTILAAASFTFDGDFSATVSVEDPIELSASATGKFRKPYTLDLLDLDAVKNTKPEIVFDVDLPSFGDLRNLTFKDVIGLLQDALKFLVGEEEGDTVESCSGGLLGKEVFGEPVFTKQIPVVGVSACNSASFLKVIVDAVDTLLNDAEESEGSSTFQALEKKLEALLQDGVGGDPGVDIKTTDDDVRSVLELDITLDWGWDEVYQLKLDLNEIFEGLELDSDIAKFAKGLGKSCLSSGLTLSPHLSPMHISSIGS